MANVLIIDDDKSICHLLSKMVHSKGHSVQVATSMGEGLNAACSNDLDVVFLDVNLPDGNGLDLLPQIMKTRSNPEVIIMTGTGDPDGAALAIESGAWDYIQKPSSINEMMLPFLRAIDYREKKQNTILTRVLDRAGIIGSSTMLKQSLDQLAQIAESDSSLLITGETGTGKELFALAAHKNSSKSKNNFVAVDCAALPENLVESILFGHVKGAYTGAEKDREGLISHAHNGTLFLDEVGEMPLSIQKSFLRVLETHRFRPIGGKEEYQSDFRLVSSTNRDLHEMVQNGQFRSDLLFRLCSFEIKLPPLREREGDAKELGIYHVNRICKNYNEKPKGFSPDFFEALLSYDWPGNVRELVNVMDISFTAARHEPILFSRHLPTNIRVQLARKSVNQFGSEKPAGHDASEKQKKGFSTLVEVREAGLASIESNYFKELIDHTNGDIKKISSISGIGRSRLYELLKKHSLLK